MINLSSLDAVPSAALTQGPTAPPSPSSSTQQIFADLMGSANLPDLPDHPTSPQDLLQLQKGMSELSIQTGLEAALGSRLGETFKTLLNMQ